MKATLLSTVIALGLLAGGPVLAAETKAADDIKVYEPGTIRPDAYTVVKRLWTETWRSAFVLPSFPDAAAAVAAMKQEAVRIGADAVTNVICLPNAGWRQRAASVYCHGQLIKMKHQ